VIDSDHIRADAVEPETPVACEESEYFLSTFVVDTERVPERATPSD